MNGDTPSRASGLTFAQQIASFPSSFWIANFIELIERFSFFGVRTIAALYIVAASEEGGLALSNTDKGIFFGVWSLIQCLLPMFTGGFSDRYGYRVSLMLAYGINIVGYALMGYTTSWWSFMGACCLIGVGTAIFKPPLHGTLAHCVDERNSSVGWGMFYQVVNIGGFIGPLVTGYLRLLEWRYAFFAAAGIILVNVLVTALFLKDFAKDRGEGEQGEAKGPGEVFIEAVTTLKDLRFTLFLAIFSGFFFMFMQLFDQLSIFIDQWIDSNDVASYIARVTGMDFFKEMAADGGQVNPEWIVNVDAGSIIVLVLLISYISGKFRHISAMIVGMFIACVGLLMYGTAVTGWSCILGILVFSIGEMACSPKFSEYIGLMAPPEKKALYMGYSNIPFAVGWAGANFVGGPLYDRLSDVHRLARDYLIVHAGKEADAVNALSKGEVLPALAAAIGGSESAAKQILWQHYHPQTFWYVCMGIGLASTLAMVGYHFGLKTESGKPVEQERVP